MRIGVRRMWVAIGVTLMASSLAAGCRPQADTNARQPSQVQDSMPTTDHHPPARTPEN